MVRKQRLSFYGPSTKNNTAMKEFIKKYWQFILILLFLIWFARSSILRQWTIDTTVFSTAKQRDSVIVENKIIQVKYDIDSVKILEKDSTIAKINQDREVWKKKYKAMRYTHKVLIAEGLVGGQIIIKDGLACFTESQLDSVNYIGKERNDLVNILEQMNDVIALKDNLIDFKSQQLEGVEFVVDIQTNEIDSLRIINKLCVDKVNKNGKKLRRNRKGWFFTGLFALAEAAWIKITN